MNKINLFNRYSLLIILPLCLSNCGPSAEKMEAQKAADKSRLADSVSLVQAELEEKTDANEPTLAKDINLNTKTPSDKKLIKTSELKFKVNNVLAATEKIEDITAKYDGYIAYSNLQNRQEEYSRTQISRDSVLICQQITVINEIQLRVPNAKLDSFIRNLNPLVVFLDSRVIKMNDVTFQYLGNQKKAERLKNYGHRQTNHIENKDSKLKETTSAEENLLNKQIQTDETQISNLILDDQLKYCDISMEIYQKPIIIKDVTFDFNYVSSSKPNIFKRIIDSVIYGWWILEEIIVFLIKCWGIFVLIACLVIIIRFILKRIQK